MGAHLENKSKCATPLPKGPIMALSGMYVTNSLAITILLPFAAFMVARFQITDDSTKLGYYAGYLASSYFVGNLLSSFMWGVLSDKIGRRPVLLFGLAANFVCALLFGFSISFQMAMGARFLNGLLSGVVPVAKTMLSEICDESNQAAGFSIIGVCWGIGLLLGPALGGFLCEPADKYSNLFAAGSLFDQFPFALPLLVLAALTFVWLCFAIVLLPETLGKAKAAQDIPLERILVAQGREGAGQESEFAPLVEPASEAGKTTAVIEGQEGGALRAAIWQELSPRNALEEPKSMLGDGKGEQPYSRADSQGQSACDAAFEGSHVAARAMGPGTGKEVINSREREHEPAATGSSDRLSSLRSQQPKASKSEEPDCTDPALTPGAPCRSSTEHSLPVQGSEAVIERETASLKPEASLPISTWPLAGLSDWAGRRGKQAYSLLRNKEEGLGPVASTAFTGSNRGYGLLKDECRTLEGGSVSGDSGVRSKTGEEENVSMWKAVFQERDVVVTASMYCLLGFVFAAFDEIFPLWCLTDWKHGGLGFGTNSVGLAQTAGGVSLIPFQLLAYPHMVNRFGPLKTLRIGVGLCLPLAAFPVLRHLSKNPYTLQALIMIGMGVRSVGSLCSFTSIFLLLTNAVRKPKYMGAVNGMSQTGAGIFRAVAPTLAGSIFAWSIGSHKIAPFDYHFTFILLGLQLLVVYYMTHLLPPSIDQRKFVL